MKTIFDLRFFSFVFSPVVERFQRTKDQNCALQCALIWIYADAKRESNRNRGSTPGLAGIGSERLARSGQTFWQRGENYRKISAIECVRCNLDATAAELFSIESQRFDLSLISFEQKLRGSSSRQMWTIRTCACVWLLNLISTSISNYTSRVILAILAILAISYSNTWN